MRKTKQMSTLSRRDFLKGAGLAGGLAAMGLAGCGQQDTQAGATTAAATTAGTHTVTDMGGTRVEVPTDITAYADGWYAHNEVSIMFNKAQGMVATRCDPKSYAWMYK